MSTKTARVKELERKERSAVRKMTQNEVFRHVNKNLSLPTKRTASEISN